MTLFENKSLPELLTPLQIEIHDAICVAPKHGSEYCMLDGVMLTWIAGLEKIVVAHERSSEKQGLEKGLRANKDHGINQLGYEDQRIMRDALIE